MADTLSNVAIIATLLGMALFVARAKPLPDERRLRARAHIINARQSHVDWANALVDPDFANTFSRRVVTAGDVAHHREWIAAYDEVLAVLR